jgi:hypothetical protein
MNDRDATDVAVVNEVFFDLRVCRERTLLSLIDAMTNARVC